MLLSARAFIVCGWVLLALAFLHADQCEPFRYGVRDRHVEVRLVKAAEGFWPHMLNAENKKRYKNMCKVDWDRWIDSDDEVRFIFQFHLSARS